MPHWTLTGTSPSYTLIISGTGAMENYTSQYYQYQPWFGYGSNIKTLVIQEGITTIGNLAFWGCSDLTIVTSLNPVPPYADSAFYLVGKCTLKVPANAVSAYKAANVWKNFGTITGISELRFANTTYRRQIHIVISGSRGMGAILHQKAGGHKPTKHI